MDYLDKNDRRAYFYTRLSLALLNTSGGKYAK